MNSPIKIEYLCLLEPQDRSEVVQSVKDLAREFRTCGMGPGAQNMFVRLGHVLDLMGELDLLIEALEDPDLAVEFNVNGMEKYDKWRKEVIGQ